MLVTETEAKTKWCPQAINVSVSLVNASAGAGFAPTRCMGSGCMAWRDGGHQRETIRNYRDDPTVLPRQGTAHDYPDGWKYSHTDSDQGRTFNVLHRLKPNAEPVGYCGLARRPK